MWLLVFIGSSSICSDGNMSGEWTRSFLPLFWCDAMPRDIAVQIVLHPTLLKQRMNNIQPSQKATINNHWNIITDLCTGFYFSLGSYHLCLIFKGWFGKCGDKSFATRLLTIGIKKAIEFRIHQHYFETTGFFLMVTMLLTTQACLLHCSNLKWRLGGFPPERGTGSQALKPESNCWPISQQPFPSIVLWR